MAFSTSSQNTYAATLRKARQQNPVVSVFLKSNPSRIYSIMVPSDKSWESFLSKLITRFDLSSNDVDDESEEGDILNSIDPFTLYSLELLQSLQIEGAVEVEEKSKSKDDENGKTFVLIDPKSSTMKNIPHKATIRLDVLPTLGNEGHETSGKPTHPSASETTSFFCLPPPREPPFLFLFMKPQKKQTPREPQQIRSIKAISTKQNANPKDTFSRI